MKVGGGGPYTTVDQFAQDLRLAVQAVGSPPSSLLSSPLTSPISSPLGAGGVHFSFGSPLTSAKLDPALLGDYLRAAFRVWIEEIRPRVHALCACGCDCGANPGGDHGTVPSAPDECLLLARVDIPVVSLGGGEWRVDDTKTIGLDESRRPLLVHMRLLQEWAVSGGWSK